MARSPLPPSPLSLPSTLDSPSLHHQSLTPHLIPPIPLKSMPPSGLYPTVLLVALLLAVSSCAALPTLHHPRHQPGIQGFIATLCASPSLPSSSTSTSCTSHSSPSSSSGKRRQLNVRTAALRDPRFRFSLSLSSSSSSSFLPSSPSDKEEALSRLVTSLLSLRGGGAQQAAAAAQTVLGPTTVRCVREERKGKEGVGSVGRGWGDDD